jgi:hypothetical protein
MGTVSYMALMGNMKNARISAANSEQVKPLGRPWRG